MSYIHLTPFQKLDIISQLVIRPNVAKMLELSLEHKMMLFTSVQSFLENQKETGLYSIEDRLFLREIKVALIKELSELKD